MGRGGFPAPLGLEAAALVPIGWGVGAIVWTAETIVDWPGAALTVAAMSDWAIVVADSGWDVVVPLRQRWRHLGLIMLLR